MLKRLLWILLGLVVAFLFFITCIVLYATKQSEKETAERPVQAQRRLSRQRAQQRDTASLRTLCRFVRREYRQQHFDQAISDIRLVLARHPHTPEARELSALHARIDSLTTATRQRRR